MEKIHLSDKTKQTLNSLDVAVVYFFGSRSQDANLKFSDYDIGIVFNSFKQITNSLDLYQKVYATLNTDIPDNISGPKLDISFLQTASPALQASAIKYGNILFESDPNVRADYEENVVQIYDDYLPLKREYESATIGSFSK